MSGVRIAVAHRAAARSNQGRRSAVVSAEAETWAMVTPIIAVDRSRSGRWNASM